MMTGQFAICSLEIVKTVRLKDNIIWQLKFPSNFVKGGQIHLVIIQTRESQKCLNSSKIYLTGEI